MILLGILKESIAALWANRLRSFLTLLGMVMGVTSVITIVSTVEGMQNSIEDALSTLGPHSFIVTRFGIGMTSTPARRMAAVTGGNAVKRFNRKGEFHISKWARPQDKVTWYLEAARPGSFEVEISYAANAPSTSF